MEGKRLAAWCLLVVVLLSTTQQRPAAAMSKFCRCYKQCYADCRKDTPPYPCNFGCLEDCFNAMLPPARPTSAADCNRICLIRVCGVMSTAASMAVAGDAAEAACLAACRNSIGHSAAAPRKDTTTKSIGH
ncbi:hypothetical protein BDA96_04G016200 [Sorghum bicolor]|uniref:Acidic protein n=2 Tax=Sorghum bicolor TaxID=4558 RepID=C5XSD2_SORBI|nr:hypothetical protein SORBI_3004G014300 [Sorghum bicolor]KAG0531352.1 hypothetical protein BDA96_04G016200 [Sorghum bicolor]